MPTNDSPDRLQLKELLDEAKPLMLPMFPDQQKNGCRKARSPKTLSLFSPSTPNITTTSAPSSATLSPNQNPKPNGRQSSTALKSRPRPARARATPSREDQSLHRCGEDVLRNRIESYATTLTLSNDATRQSSEPQKAPRISLAP